jgi:hypothetical protein
MTKRRNETMEILIEGIPHIPITDAAKDLKTTPARILMLIKQNVLKGCPVEGEWYVDKNTLGCFRSHDLRGKEPGGCGSSCNGCKES